MLRKNTKENIKIILKIAMVSVLVYETLDGKDTSIWILTTIMLFMWDTMIDILKELKKWTR